MFGIGKRKKTILADLLLYNAPHDVDVFSAAEKISLPNGTSKTKNHETCLPALAVVKWGNESN